MIKTGLDVLADQRQHDWKGCRFGLLSNQASVNAKLEHARVLLQKKFGSQFTTLFSPQHGFFSEKQDNMIESAHQSDPVTGLPIYSLYGEYRKPTESMFADLDILFIDLIDVGTRVYTFIYTMAYCLERAAECGKKIIILDRPNPIGGKLIEGNILQDNCRSFVGMYPLPMRHGLTMGELALLINAEYGIGVELEIIPLKGWKRSMTYRHCGYPWIAPSPNMPTPETAMVYPGQVLWEGTTVSEGRGTTQPFEFVGAPYWNHDEITDILAGDDLPGCILRPVVFQPTSGKWSGNNCFGFHIYVTNESEFRPYRTGLALLRAVMGLYGGEFSYKSPPYEYEFEKLPLDLIIGDKGVRLGLEQQVPLDEIEMRWQKDLAEFDELRREYFLYL
ncbi:exo-beta-N-acetylmuramidase NamZ family protein [Desulfomarina sp.]